MGRVPHHRPGGKSRLSLSRYCASIGRMCQNGGMFVNSTEIRSSKQSGDQRSSVPDFPASPTALQEIVMHLMMNVTLQENSKKSFGRLNPDGSLLKMSQGSAQASLDGSLENSCMTFPRWGILSDGVVGALQMSEPAIGESECSLLPTLAARDYKDVGINTDYRKLAKKSKLAGVIAM